MAGHIGQVGRRLRLRWHAGHELRGIETNEGGDGDEMVLARGSGMAWGELGHEVWVQNGHAGALVLVLILLVLVLWVMVAMRRRA